MAFDPSVVPLNLPSDDLSNATYELDKTPYALKASAIGSAMEAIDLIEDSSYDDLFDAFVSCPELEHPFVASETHNFTWMAPCSTALSPPSQFMNLTTPNRDDSFQSMDDIWDTFESSPTSVDQGNQILHPLNWPSSSTRVPWKPCLIHGNSGCFQGKAHLYKHRHLDEGSKHTDEDKFMSLAYGSRRPLSVEGPLPRSQPTHLEGSFIEPRRETYRDSNDLDLFLREMDEQQHLNVHANMENLRRKANAEDRSDTVISAEDLIVCHERRGSSNGQTRKSFTRGYKPSKAKDSHQVWTIDRHLSDNTDDASRRLM